MKLLLQASILTLLTFARAGHARQATDVSESNPPPATHTALAGTQNPVPPPVANPAIKRILQAMDEADTGGHPDLFGQFAGMRRLFEGDYAGAMKYFKIGAYYADKLSEMSIGMLYLHGRGVDKDAASACAWITLAAERNYPTYRQAREQVCAALDSAQRARSTTILTSLLSEYSDAIAQPRMKFQLTMTKNALTGSHLGHDFGVSTVSVQAFPVNCGGYRLVLGGVEVPPRGCGRYDPGLSDAKKYFAARDAQESGTVTVGPLTKVNPPISAAEKKKPDTGL